MAFNKTDLESDLVKEFTINEKTNKTLSDHGDALADAYDKYCKEITTKYGAKLIITGKDNFKSTFISVISALTVPTLANYGSAIQSACSTYWANSSFPLLIGAPPTFASQTKIEISPPSVNAGLITTDLSPGVSASKAAEIIAENMDIGTKTITTTHTGILSSTGSNGTDGPNPIE